MTVSNHPVEIDGEVLRPPTLRFFAPAQEIPLNGVWNVMRKHLYLPRQLSKWAVVDLSGRKGEEARTRFISELEGCLRSLGAIDSSEPKSSY